MRVHPGSTLLELLVVLALLGVAGLAFVHVAAPSPARQAARQFTHTVQAQRLQALAGDYRSVELAEDRVTFLLGGGPAPCADPAPSTWELPRGVAVTTWLRDGIVWAPDGSGRRCAGGGVYGGRVRFDDGASRWDVVLASTGRIRIERADP